DDVGDEAAVGRKGRRTRGSNLIEIARLQAARRLRRGRGGQRHEGDNEQDQRLPHAAHEHSTPVGKFAYCISYLVNRRDQYRERKGLSLPPQVHPARVVATLREEDIVATSDCDAGV